MSGRTGWLLVSGFAIVMMVTVVYVSLLGRILVGIAGTAMLLGWRARCRRGAAPGVRRLVDGLLIMAGMVATYWLYVL